MVRRSGRRPGNQDTKSSILQAARETFADKGFDAASIRAIAGAAGVDPALVHHYFGTKEKLFLAAMNFPADPAELIPGALAGPREQAGERLIRTVLSVWDSPGGTAAMAMFRSALSNEWTARLLREFVVMKILRPAVSELVTDADQAPLRSSFIVTQIGGMIMARYVFKVEPLVSADPEVVVAALGPNVQRFLTDPMPEIFGSSG